MTVRRDESDEMDRRRKRKVPVRNVQARADLEKRCGRGSITEEAMGLGIERVKQSN